MTDISVQEVKQALDQGRQVILLDVRSPEELLRGKIDGAINVPLDKIKDQIELVIPDKSTIIYVYCLSASRSPQAVKVMEQLGYQHVFNVSHGLLAWRIAKYPTV